VSIVHALTIALATLATQKLGCEDEAEFVIASSILPMSYRERVRAMERACTMCTMLAPPST